MAADVAHGAPAANAARPSAPAAAAGSALSAPNQWWLVSSLAILTALSSIDRQILALLVNPIEKTLGISDTQMSLISGLAFGMVNILVALPAGWIADRWLRRGAIGVCAVIWSSMTVLTGLVSSFGQLFAARAAVGVTEGMITPSAQSLIRDGIYIGRRGRAFALMGMAPLCGTGLAMLMGGAVLHAVTPIEDLRLPLIGAVEPWQFVLVVIGAAGIPLSLLMLTVKEPPRTVSAQLAKENPGYGAALRNYRDNWTFYVPLLGFSIGNAVVSAVFGAWLPAMLGRVYHMTGPQIGLTFGVAILFGAPIGLWIAGTVIDATTRLANRKGPPLVGIVGTAIILFASVLAPIAPNAFVFWPLFLCLILVSGVPLPAAASMLAHVTPSRLMGKTIGLNFLAQGLVAQALGPTIVALVADNLFEKGPRSIAYAMSTVNLFAAIFALVCGLFVYRAYSRRTRFEA